MRIHHLDCISSCPLGGRLFDDFSNCIACRGRLCCHCLLIETEQGLVLVDTGFGLQDVRNPKRRLSAFFLALMSPDFREDMTAVRQIEALGFMATDVRHIVLTHLDFDHAGGLDDFPAATVHMMAPQSEAALPRATPPARIRGPPQQWATRPQWRTYSAIAGERWFGFDCVRGLKGLP